MGRTREAWGRQWSIIRELHTARRGLTASQLMERTGAKKATLYRDLRDLRDVAGWAIVDEPVNGEVRYRLDGEKLPALAPTADQAAALRVGTSLFAPLAGTQVAFAYDEVLDRVRGVAEPSHLHIVPASARGVGVRTIEAAIEHRRRVRLRYRPASAKGAAKTYLVEPVFLHLSAGDLYLVGFSVDVGARRTFKLARVEGVEWTDEEAAPHPEIVATDVFTTSRKAWAGDDVEVRVRLSADVPWKVDEYPMDTEGLVQRYINLNVDLCFECQEIEGIDYYDFDKPGAVQAPNVHGQLHQLINHVGPNSQWTFKHFHIPVIE